MITTIILIIIAFVVGIILALRNYNKIHELVRKYEYKKEFPERDCKNCEYIDLCSGTCAEESTLLGPKNTLTKYTHHHETVLYCNHKDVGYMELKSYGNGQVDYKAIIPPKWCPLDKK